MKNVKLRQVDWMPRVNSNNFKELDLTTEQRSLHDIHYLHVLVFIYTDKAELRYNYFKPIYRA